MTNLGDCYDPGAVKNGHKFPINGPYNQGDVIVYICDDGYELQGDPFIACDTTGHYIKPIPTCELPGGLPIALSITAIACVFDRKVSCYVTCQLEL